MDQFSFSSAGGLSIAAYSWRTEGMPRAVVAVVPGFNSHSGYYDSLARQLNADGISVYSVDLRGRGKSDGARFFVESFDDS